MPVPVPVAVQVALEMVALEMVAGDVAVMASEVATEVVAEVGPSQVGVPRRRRACACKKSWTGEEDCCNPTCGKYPVGCSTPELLWTRAC